MSKSILAVSLIFLLVLIELNDANSKIKVKSKALKSSNFEDFSLNELLAFKNEIDQVEDDIYGNPDQNNSTTSTTTHQTVATTNKDDKHKHDKKKPHHHKPKDRCPHKHKKPHKGKHDKHGKHSSKEDCEPETTTTTLKSTTATSPRPTYPDSFIQVVRKCKQLLKEFIKQSENNPQGELNISYKLEDSDWKNKLAASLLDEIEKQINSRSIDFKQMELSIVFSDTTGLLTINSNKSSLNLPFSLEKNKSFSKSKN